MQDRESDELIETIGENPDYFKSIFGFIRGK